MTTELRKTVFRDLCILALIIGLLFSLFLGNRPLVSPDEGRYSEIPRQMLLHHDYVTPRINNIKYFEKPPFFYWLQSFGVQIFGMNEWGFRITTAFMGLFGCFISYFAGFVLFNRRTGFLAALILATSTLYFGLARFITIDMTMTVLLSATLLSFALQERTQNRRYLWAMYVFAALATLTKGFIGFLLPGLVIGVWVLLNGRIRELKRYKLISGTLLFLVITLPWHILAQIRNPEFLHFYVFDQQILRYFTDISGREQAWWFLPSVLIGGFLPWIVWLPQSLRSAWIRWREENDSVMCLLLLWPAIVFLLFWCSKSQLSPYILPMFPALAILTAHHLDEAINKKSAEWWPLMCFALLAIGICAFGMIRFHAADPALLISFCCVLLSALLAIFLYWEKGFTSALYGLMTGFSVFLLSLNFSLPKYDSRSIKPLTDTLKLVLRDNDEVASFHYLYMELPVYLNKDIVLVHYYGELKYGIQHDNVHNVWVSNDEFWHHWLEPQRQFVVMNMKDYITFNRKFHYPLFLLAQTRTNVLLSNQDVKI